MARKFAVDAGCADARPLEHLRVPDRWRKAELRHFRHRQEHPPRADISPHVLFRLGLPTPPPSCAEICWPDHVGVDPGPRLVVLAAARGPGQRPRRCCSTATRGSSFDARDLDSCPHIGENQDSPQNETLVLCRTEETDHQGAFARLALCVVHFTGALTAWPLVVVLPVVFTPGPDRPPPGCRATARQRTPSPCGLMRQTAASWRATARVHSDRGQP